MNQALRDMPAWGISFVVNIAMLLVMHFMVVSIPQSLQVNTITSSIEEIDEEQYEFNDVATDDQVGTEGDMNSLASSVAAATKPPEQQAEQTQKQIEDSLIPTPVAFNEAIPLPPEKLLTESFDAKGSSEEVQGGVEGAMDRVTFEISSSLNERQTLVMWMFDASGSMDKRREEIANRFDNIYKQLTQKDSTDGLYTGVASFGKGLNVMTPQPVSDVQKAVVAVRSIKSDDSSSDENVFQATGTVVDQWKLFKKSKGRWNKLVFIVTDERGDDVEHLENLIALCRRYGVRVYVIGNAAVFGQQKGFVSYTYPEDQFRIEVAVDQGPETAFPDRLQLPFWGGGNRYRLERMSSSFGPYALTRLCAETGGMYLITDQASGYQFDRALMRNYVPSYAPIPVQEQEIRRNQAKAVLTEAAVQSNLRRAPTPQLVFLHTNDNVLRQEVTAGQRLVVAFEDQVKQLHNLLNVGEPARDTLDDPRWRAAYDLAMGRTKAMLVRAYGYNVTLANMKSTPKTFEKEGNNEWILVPSKEIDTGPSVRKLAEEARKYLKRVIDEHPGTPWAVLAETELSKELGWGWRESHRPIPENLNPADPDLLQQLEEERMKNGGGKPRPLPNL